VHVLSLTNSPVPSTPGVYPLYMSSGGIPRYYQLSIPASYNGATDLPLMFIMGGHSQSADEFASQHPGLAIFANNNGMILVIPEATTSQRGIGWFNMSPTPEYP